MADHHPDARRTAERNARANAAREHLRRLGQSSGFPDVDALLGIETSPGDQWDHQRTAKIVRGNSWQYGPDSAELEKMSRAFEILGKESKR